MENLIDFMVFLRFFKTWIKGIPLLERLQCMIIILMLSNVICHSRNIKLIKNKSKCKDQLILKLHGKYSFKQEIKKK